MIKKLFFAAAFILAVAAQSNAQYQADALIFSQQIYGSTSKSLAMGGALSPVGADLSVMASNPAGLALFKSNHFTFSSNFMLNSAETDYLGNTRNEERFNYSVDNLGFSITKRNESSAWKAFSFGLAYNRMNEYSSDITASGINTESSIHDYYVYRANRAINLSKFREELAFDAYLINDDGNEYYSHITDAGLYGERQRREEIVGGGKGELDFSLAGNYNDALSLGIGVGTQFISYNRRIFYTESDYDDVFRLDTVTNTEVQVDPEFMEYNETLHTNGTGINVKAGFIYHPVSLFRLSFAFHTRTLTSFNEEYKTGIRSRFSTPDANNNYEYYYDSDYNYYDWKLRQPRRVNVGTAFVLDQYPIGKFYTLPMTLSAEYEYVDYSSMHLRASGSDFDRENELIISMYKETHNLRSGLEVNLGQLKFRGGYALYQSAYASDAGWFDNARVVYSGGIGFAGNFGYIDIGYSYTAAPKTMYMYDANIYYPNDPLDYSEPTADVSRKLHYVSITLGLR